MTEAKDPAIKLFGQNIALPENGTVTLVSADCSVAEDCRAISAPEDSGSDRDRSSMVEDSKVSGTEGEEEQQKDDQDAFVGKPTESNQQDVVEPLATEDLTNSRKSPESDDKPKTPSIDEETGGVNTSKTENNQNDTNNSQKKILKKPDKILPCPRCNSMDTKFCYYNNYNVNQPRHFCKSCQRYWTAGGTMRNVPVGAGRRKSKNSASHCRPITISEALQVAQIDASNGIPPAFKASGPVLSFGPDAPLCESMTSALNLAEIKVPNGIQNGLYKLEKGISVTCNGGENGDDCSSGSSITTTNSADERSRNGLQEPMLGNMHGFPSQIPCLSGFPWPYPWNSAVSVPAPAFYPSRFPIPFYPAPYWNCSVPGAWSIPWVSPESPVMNQKPPCSGPNSPNLGKHSRDGDLLKPNNSVGKEPVEQKNPDGAILIPKTLRIDDPDEAARSSIWTTLGIKNDFNCRGGLFKAFQPKNGEKDHIAENSPALQANPAALSRSLSFQERA